MLAGSSEEVRTLVRGKWLVSDPGDGWSAKVDIRDLGGHLDVTLQARAATLCSWLSGVLPRVRHVHTSLISKSRF